MHAEVLKINKYNFIKKIIFINFENLCMHL